MRTEHPHRTSADEGDGPRDDGGGGGHGSRAYLLLGIAVVVHFVVMFALTYAGVNTWDEIFVNLNRFYMAVLMVATMPIVMIVLMWRMFHSRRANLAIIGVAASVFVAAFVMLRTEALVGNEQFLRSMIPHHSIAIHTCENAQIDDQQIEELCGEIIESQRQEIAEMRRILARLDQ